MAHRDSGKFHAKHGTLTSTAAEVADAAARLPQVDRVTPGVIKQTRGGRRWLKFIWTQVGWQVKVGGDRAVQTLFIYTKQRHSTKTSLEKSFAH
ncbi:hypothetical protein COT99_02190 [Candidatus Falkowbacteria bacterium CG10_big_fil_rev_8_21_14_0_10_43_10]|uniref:Uncharacterized protein n=1 Tax=Candidatus Falkowbacteria bacterium CG10_big_fil_rev_8_21_14_0_10_43_10 TaxID=1974567 RepID=A0A2H0V411_9BACT|nr:MAG: hypothetical protein COT99_02190 [Candidatus Falkowbacteria bacterium CG10_big_fil_rev_8_21_14_0_10_43_10]